MKILCFASLVALVLAGCTGERHVVATASPPAPGHLRNAVIVDVRTPAEFATGHATAAVNVPMGELEERIAQVVPDKTSPVTVYCQTGGRSAAAKTVLQRLGYSEVTDLGSLANARKRLQKNAK